MQIGYNAMDEWEEAVLFVANVLTIKYLKHQIRSLVTVAFCWWRCHIHCVTVSSLLSML